MTPPLASIIIPTFNRPRFLAQAIESALAQTYPAVEVIVVDDGSTDDTADALAEFGQRIVRLKQEYRGTGAARNAGLRGSRGEFVAFLDDDDALTPESIARRAAILAERPEVGLVYSDVYLTDEAGALLGRYSAERGGRMPSGDLYEALLPRNFIPTHSALWRRCLLERVGGFPERSVSEDWECLIRATEFASIQYLDEPLGYYRLHSDNITHRRAQLVQGYGIVQQQIAASSRFARVAPKRRAHILTRYAAQQWLEGDPALGRAFLRMARQADPLNPLPLCLAALMLVGRRVVSWSVYRLWQVQAKLRPAASATAYFRQSR